jgi:hypothetical protein
MEKTVMGLFDEADADRIVKQLRSAGIPLSNISVIDEEPDEGIETKGAAKAVSSAAEEVKEKAGEVWDRLKGFFGAHVAEHHAQHFAEGIRRGGTLVAVDIHEAQADRVRILMEQFNVVDLDVRSKEWQQTGWTGGQAPSQKPAQKSAQKSPTAEFASMGGVHIFQRTNPPRPLGESDVDETFRREFEAWRQGHMPTAFVYEEWMPAYRFGHDLERAGIKGEKWAQVEPRAKASWESSHAKTWDRFKDIIREAWEKVSGQRPE